MSNRQGSFVIDMHSDIATDIAIRRARGERQVFNKYHYKKLTEAGVFGLFSVLWVEPKYRENSAARVIQLLSSLLADVRECADVVEIVGDREAFTRVVQEGKIGLFLGVEGMTFVEQWPVFEHGVLSGQSTALGNELPKREGELDECLRQSLGLLEPLGLRHAILVWGEDNAIASGPVPGHGVSTNRGLTAFGRRAVRVMQEQNILVDISHLDDASIDAVFEETSGLVIASHSNVRAICDVPRNLLDKHIDEIGRRNGVIGMNAYPDFIHPLNAGIDSLIDHIVYIANRIGIEHVAFGFDFTDFLEDESSGWDRPEVGLRSARDVPLLLSRMQERGFSDMEIQKVACDNALRIIESF